ncbi:MAG: hypothetical protein GC189_12655 [Alphaproteobacteria bacterium]|nr:hypothetical protein [Alphaproteobacteria bacterium]
MVLDFASAAGAALIVSLLISRAMIAAGVQDTPRERRNVHERPTPTSGGFAIAAGMAAGLFVLTLPPLQSWSADLGGESLARSARAAAIAIGFLIIGGVDDVRALGPVTKFGLFAALAVAVAFVVARADVFGLGPHMEVRLPPLAATLGSALFVFTLVNTINFIDGANGLAPGSAAIGLFGMAAIGLAADAPHATALALCAGAAVLGFLYWNFPHGKLFAGDSGALFIGAISACIGLILVQDGGVSPFIPPMCFFPLLADVLLTLAWRLPRRERLLEGHRDHLFHIALRAGMPHRTVSTFYWLATLHCVLVAFIAAEADRATRAAGAEGWSSVVGYLPAAAFAVLALLALRISSRIRAFAAARGLDAP